MCSKCGQFARPRAGILRAPSQLALTINMTLFTLWASQARLRPFSLQAKYTVFAFAPPVLLLISWLLWRQARKATGRNGLIARAAAVTLILLVIQLAALYPRVRFVP